MKKLIIFALIFIPATAFAWGLLPIYPGPQDINILNVAENMRRIETMMKNVPDLKIRRQISAGVTGAYFTISGVTAQSTAEASLASSPGGSICIVYTQATLNNVVVVLNGSTNATCEVIISVKY